MKIIIFLLPICFALPAKNELNEKCPKGDILISFGDNERCEAYIECKDGVATEKTCPIGLVFEERNGKCGFPQYASCKKISTPKSSDTDCPYKNGIFFTGNEANCGDYNMCDDDVPERMKCSEGLAFNEETGQCDWPDKVKTCNPEKFFNITCDSVMKTKYRYLPHSNKTKHFDCTSGRPRLIHSSIPPKPQK